MNIYYGAGIANTGSHMFLPSSLVLAAFQLLPLQIDLHIPTGWQSQISPKLYLSYQYVAKSHGNLQDYANLKDGAVVVVDTDAYIFDVFYQSDAFQYNRPLLVYVSDQYVCNSATVFLPARSRAECRKQA